MRTGRTLLVGMGEGEQGEGSLVDDGPEPAGAEAQLMRELSLADVPAHAPASETAAQGVALATELDGPENMQHAESLVWEPSIEHEVPRHDEPNFLPPFANEENKGINRKVQV